MMLQMNSKVQAKYQQVLLARTPSAIGGTSALSAMYALIIDTYQHSKTSHTTNPKFLHFLLRAPASSHV